MERHVLEKGGKLNAPLSLFLEITNVCNQRCLFCIQPGKRQLKLKADETCYMSLACVEKLIHEAKTLGVLEFYITGGEPLCHPQFLEIVTLLKKSGFCVSILTNGINLSSTDIKILSSILEPEQDILLLGLDAAERVAYRNLRGEDHFESLLETLEMLRAAGLPFATQAVLVKSNIDLLEDTWKLSSHYGARAHILIQPYRKKEIETGTYASEEEMRLSLERLRNHMTQPDEHRNSLIFPGAPGIAPPTQPAAYKPGQEQQENADTRLHCRAGYTSCAVNVRGEVHICSFALDSGLSVGNLFRTSLEETWESIGQFMKKSHHMSPAKQGRGCPFISFIPFIREWE